MQREVQIQGILKRMEGQCPAGYALAFHISYATPQFLFQTYATPWIEIYSQKGYVMQDPTVRWGFENTGWVRWSDLAAQDSAGVLDDAAAHGLRFGACYATDAGESRSVTSFARGDREFTDDEIAGLANDVDQLHALTADLDALSPQTAEELRAMSIRFTHPGAHRG